MHRVAEPADDIARHPINDEQAVLWPGQWTDCWLWNIGLRPGLTNERHIWVQRRIAGLLGESAMKATTFLFGACALLVFPTEMAVAGPCTAEIENLTKLLASRDAGAGPTAGPAGTTTGQHPPTSAMGAADPSTAASAAAAESAKPQHPPTAAMNQATQGGGTSPPTGGAVREHPPTAAMSGATQGGATSPQDVQSQSRGGPTAVQQAEGARRPAAEKLAAAQNALEQARSFDRNGQQSECMDAVEQAKGFAR
jgi:hypothetical protein